MSAEVERMARLLCEARYRLMVQKLDRPFDAAEMQRYIDVSWDDLRFTTRAEDLHEAGLTLVPREPDEARVERVADAVMRSQGYSEADIDFYGNRPSISPVRQAALDIARAACQAMVEG